MQKIIYESKSRPDRPDVSVIIPYFNMGRYIEDALDSISRQSHPSLEVVIIDDGSDEPLSISKIDELGGDRLLVLRQSNGGVCSARNAAIEAARGEYIVPLDPDDMIRPQFIPRCLAEIKTSNSIGVVYTDMEFFGDESKRFDVGDAKLPDMLVQNSVVVTAMFRKQHWEEFGGYRDVMTKGLEDYDFWLNFLARGLEFRKIPEPLFCYRRRENSRTDDFLRDKENYPAMMKEIFVKHADLYRVHCDYIFEKMVELQAEKIKSIARRRKKLLSLPVGKGRKLRVVLE